eukprot:CAMPEP_0202897774 /NCGR_PEP_ID=MMETSP1392-20130828/6460_1 /ASSEMBLY_ACC=CAM_ASM_000868 /TAXON_ID=225041 /ORGANISM="Chlamydomonas chlamydogama, Strain SAG 11-48b" /LENGTH=487 /DNA_ID=CAMNT_0049583517 /DNA_START=189 /DNA_END=1652 /DNA_ORIENTATION=+
MVEKEQLPSLSRQMPASTSTPSSPSKIDFRRSVPIWSDVGPKLQTGQRKCTPSQRAVQLFNQLIQLLENEWKSVRSLNLGVKSGTSVAEELVIRKIQQWVQELHTLCISKEEAAKAVGKAARKLERSELQQLQVMLDVTDHHALSDFIRLMVYNTSEPFASVPIDHLEHLNRHKAASKTGRQSRSSGTGKAGTGFGRTRPAPERDEVLRFAGYLPEDHPLVQTAYGLYLMRLPGEEASRAASREAQERGASGRRQAMDLANDPVAKSMGPFELRSLLRSAPPPPEEVPIYNDVEHHWRNTTHTVLRDETLGCVMISDPLPPWLKLPEYKVKAMEAEKAAKQKEAMAARIYGSGRSGLATNRTGPNTPLTRLTTPSLQPNTPTVATPLSMGGTRQLSIKPSMRGSASGQQGPELPGSRPALGQEPGQLKNSFKVPQLHMNAAAQGQAPQVQGQEGSALTVQRSGSVSFKQRPAASSDEAAAKPPESVL